MSGRGESKEGGAGGSAQHHDDPMPSTSDFVKKLYKMLEDPTFQSVVSWGPQGDCFVVKDMNEFTKSILPRMFKHSNFASFVRQLNKYDFHKVKNTDDNQFGEHSWTFRHPDFHADGRDALENIKRKVPAQRKSAASLPPSSSALPNSSLPPNSLSPTNPSSTSYPYPQQNVVTAELQHEVRRLREEGEDLRGRLRSLERSYENVLVEMVGFQRGMAQQDGVMQNLISFFLGSESGKSLNSSSSTILSSSSSSSNILSSGSDIRSAGPDIRSAGSTIRSAGSLGSSGLGSALSSGAITAGSGGAGEGYGRDAMDVDGGGGRGGQYKLAPVYQGASGYVSY
ncbi:HSF-type DNA-binding-domain-containing protein [Ephemerocybe angulata]|uniref:HSF-type DNA-binding-domain-containing protein n=1 Tax=Ephemerocybe angulata TaxID=980116 RepID=A0A8H6HQF8_9AGAR|nr:HSF-type DNA-binding-domain-containing protein [Tulosesus angulatus]